MTTLTAPKKKSRHQRQLVRDVVPTPARSMNMATVAQSPARGETLELLEPVEYHYMPKVAITEGIVNGTAGRALCGEVFTPYAPGRGEGGGMAVICDRCAAIYGSLRSLGRDA